MQDKQSQGDQGEMGKDKSQDQVGKQGGQGVGDKDKSGQDQNKGTER
jgi:hypothetical protein